MVYFIRAEGTNFVKIGFTKNSVENRIAELQVGCPHRLVLIKVIDGDSSFEKELHKKFRALKIRGEWFLLQKKLQQFLCGDEKLDPQKELPSTANELMHEYANEIYLLGELQVNEFCPIRQLRIVKLITKIRIAHANVLIEPEEIRENFLLSRRNWRSEIPERALNKKEMALISQGCISKATTMLKDRVGISKVKARGIVKKWATKNGF